MAMYELTYNEIEQVNGAGLGDSITIGGGAGAAFGIIAYNTARGAATGGAVGGALGFSFGVGYAIGTGIYEWMTA